MPTTTFPPRSEPARERGKLPLSPLLALALAAFMTVLTEALPAGVLPEMARDLSVSESAMGQSLTVYAIATGVSAIPLARATATWRRKKLMLSAVAVIGIANTATAVSSHYLLTMGLRLLAGVAAAVIWSELVVYARRLAPPHLQGRALAVALAGIPLALSLGIPLGTLLGSLLGWRLTFTLVSLVTLVLLGWMSTVLPDFAGQLPDQRRPILKALRLPGVVPVLFTAAAFMLAHNILYTYVAALLDAYDMGAARGTVLLVFGMASVVSILIAGALVDHHLRTLTITSVTLFLAAAVLLATLATSPAAVYAATVLWGLACGGIANLLQTAVADAGDDRAQALYVTVCNSSIAGGGAIGGTLLATFGPASFPDSALLLLIPVLIVVVAARTHAFPAQRSHAAVASRKPTPSQR
ncbi:MFS transporter [Streptomyces sp. NPDC002886]|uniref:MFS transporter n=1 Tax=Streptomyces sp. NPDC002886 TaxID=3364667 RepID=UPI0036AA9F65